MRMELALPERFDTRQALRYLGISTEEPDSATRALLRRAERTLRAAAGPRAVAVRAARDDISPYLQGNDILRHLEGCGSCVLLACTLGAGVDAALRAAGASDMAYVVLDALASVAVEQTADAAEQTLRNEEREEGQFLTGRFSPGYSDYPIAVQNDLLRLLDAPRKIGLCATPAHLLTPRKSVTAVLGVAGHPVTGRRAGCANCALRERCAYRKEGKTCE